jgi:type I restriction enzyme S subunit
MSFKTTFKQTEIGKIPEEWEISTIDEIASPRKHSLSMGPFGSNITKDNFMPFGVPVIRGNNLTDFRFLDSDFVFVSEKKADMLSSSNVKANDIVITHRGTLGQVGIIPSKSRYPRYIVSQSGMKLTCDLSKVDADFVFYWLKSPRGQQELLKNTSQTGVPAIAQPLSSFRKVVLPKPPLKEQQSIAKILSEIDSKIELNQRINRTLEAIGQAVFRRWFVDFGFPNEEGKPYKSSDGEMTNSAMGEIPKGWAIGGLDAICEITMGQSPPGDTYDETGAGVPFFQGVRDFGFRFPSRRIYCTAPTRFAEVGDVLLSVRAPVGSLNVAEERCAIGRGVAALHLKWKHNGFLYYLLLGTRSGWEKYESEGTVFGSATKQDVHDFKIVIPAENLRDQFGELIEPLDKRILLNERESHNLTMIRDSLLPRLMSGKTRVPIPKENGEA